MHGHMELVLAACQVPRVLGEVMLRRPGRAATGGAPMPRMSPVEARFCRSVSWRRFAQSTVLPWALQGQTVEGDVLELGAGTGDMGAALLQRHPQIRLTLTDIDTEMVREARARLSSAPDVVVEVADSTGLPFSDASFDVVLSFLMLHHVVHWQAALAEAARVLKPGGVIIGYDLTASPLAKVVHVLDRSPHRLVRPRELASAAALIGLSFSIHTQGAGHLMRFAGRVGAV